MAESNMLKSIPDTGFNYSNAAAKCCPLKGNAVELNRKHGNMLRSRTYHPNKEFQTNKLLTSQNINLHHSETQQPFSHNMIYQDFKIWNFYTIRYVQNILRGTIIHQRILRRWKKQNFVDHLLFGGLPLKGLLSWNNFRLSLAEIWAWVTLISRGRGSWRDFAPVYSFSPFP